MPELPDPLTADSARNHLLHFPEAIAALLQPTRQDFERTLAALEGVKGESLAVNQQLAEVIQATANLLNIALCCTKCGEPARFRCVKNKSMPTGMFTFAHSVGSHSGTAAIPKLTLVDKPLRGSTTKQS